MGAAYTHVSAKHFMLSPRTLDRYGQNDILPPRCNIGEFCPDEEDYCEPLVPVGGACQLNRDGELYSACTLREIF